MTHTAPRLLALVTLILLVAGTYQGVHAAPATPPDYVLLNFRGYAQTMPLSCESRSAVDVARFWGVHVSEKEFFARLPKTDNPHTGFVGSVYERWGQLPPNGYGVHAEPIAGLLRAYGLRAEARYHMGLEGLRAELAAGRPVILWATPRMASQPVEMYTASDGQTVAAIRYEHTVTAVGYTQHAIYVVDSANGYRWAYGNASLLSAWNKLGQMSVVVHDVVNTPKPAESAPATIHSTAVTFTSPAPGSQVQKPLDIAGTVTLPDFTHYEVWYAPGEDPAVWTWVSGPHQSPVNGGKITAETLGHVQPGVYTLRVVVYGDETQKEGRTTFTLVP
jgi:uncharacterized protein YvpB